MTGRGLAVDPLGGFENPAALGELVGRENVGNGEKHGKKRLKD
jgi:hypothetical protein